MNKVNWTAIAVFGALGLLLVLLAAAFMGGPGYGGWGYGGWGMMGPWMMGGMFFMWLIPVGFVVLMVLGVAWVVRTVGGGISPPSASRKCPSCGRPVLEDWHHCAHCGNQLTT